MVNYSRKDSPWLNGVLYRIGPGVFILKGEKNTITLNHAFDGMPFLHRFEISSERQQVRYNSRNLATKVEEKIKDGEVCIFFGHVVHHSTVWGQFCHFLKVFNNLVFQSRLNNLIDRDPSSEMVGVTPTPNFPLPKGVNFINKDLPVLVAKTDANLLQKVNADNLVPEKLFNYSQYDKQLNGELAAAHHQYDPDTKEVFNFTLKFGMKPILTVFSSTSTGEITTLAEITHRLDKDRTPINLSYIHSFWLTKNFIIIPESPLYMKNYGFDFMASGSFVAGLKWDDSLPTYLHIISRRSDQGHIATVPVNESFFTFHVGNAWDHHDENGNISLTLDCAAFPDGDIAYQVHTFGKPRLFNNNNNNNDDNVDQKERKSNIKTNGFTFPPLPQSSFGELRRYKLTLKKLSTSTYSSISTTFETIVDNMEFLRYNQEYTMKPYRFTYGNQFESFTSSSSSSSSSEGERYSIVKVDLNNGNILKFDHEGYVCSEPIFVPKPNSDTEDDGVILSFVNIMKKDKNNNNDDDDQCFLLILNASSLKEIARCHIGFFTATTFHGSYVDQEFESIAIN
ncbi:unnamed protein product [Cunninghamella blakesleeana]